MWRVLRFPPVKWEDLTWKNRSDFTSPLHPPERCTSSSRATNRKCVASGRRRGASRPSRRMTRPPVASATRPNSPTAAVTSAPTAKPNSAPAAEDGSPCAPTTWATSAVSGLPSTPRQPWRSCSPPASVLSTEHQLLFFSGHALVNPKCVCVCVCEEWWGTAHTVASLF